MEEKAKKAEKQAEDQASKAKGKAAKKAAKKKVGMLKKKDRKAILKAKKAAAAAKKKAQGDKKKLRRLSKKGGRKGKKRGRAGAKGKVCCGVVVSVMVSLQQCLIFLSSLAEQGKTSEESGSERQGSFCPSFSQIAALSLAPLYLVSLIFLCNVCFIWWRFRKKWPGQRRL